MDASAWQLWWRWAAAWAEDGAERPWRDNARARARAQAHAMKLMTGLLRTPHFRLNVAAPHVLEQSLRQLLAWAEFHDDRHPSTARWSLCWWLQHHCAPSHALRARGEGPGTTWHDVNPDVLKELLPRLMALDHQPVRMAIVSGWPAELLGLSPDLWMKLVAICAADQGNPGRPSLQGTQEERAEDERRIMEQLRGCGMESPVVRLAVGIGSQALLAALGRRTDWPVEVQHTTLDSQGLPLLQHIGQGPAVPVEALRTLFASSSPEPRTGSPDQDAARPRTTPTLRPMDLLLMHRLATHTDGTIEPELARIAAQVLSKLAREALGRARTGVPVPEVLHGEYWLPWLTSLDFVATLERETVVRVLTASPDREVRVRLTSQLAALTIHPSVKPARDQGESSPPSSSTNRTRPLAPAGETTSAIVETPAGPRVSPRPRKSHPRR